MSKPQLFFRKRPQTRERIGIVMVVPNVYELFAEKYYADLPGGILENFGRFFKNDLKIYVYPLQRGPKDELHVIDFHHCDFYQRCSCSQFEASRR